MPESSHESPSRASLRLLRVIDHLASKLIISGLILLSIVPEVAHGPASWALIAVFLLELVVRASLLPLRRSGARVPEYFLLAMDALALISLLPMHFVPEDTSLLRLFRFGRLFLLAGYWGPLFYDILLVFVQRERKRQLVSVAAALLSLIAGSAVLLLHVPRSVLGSEHFSRDDGILELAWWAFLQLQDPGNIMRKPDLTLTFVLSVILTTGGVFVFSFVIGIGTSVVQELIDRGLHRSIGINKHILVCNVTETSGRLLEDLLYFHEQQHRLRPRIVLLGPSEAAPAFLSAPALRRLTYRTGDLLRERDQVVVDLHRARTVVLLSGGACPEDEATVARLLAVRGRNPECHIICELNHNDTRRAVETIETMSRRSRADARARDGGAGGEGAGGGVTCINTRYEMGELLALLVTQPETTPFMNDLMTSTGSELYSSERTSRFDRVLDERLRVRAWLGNRVGRAGIPLAKRETLGSLYAKFGVTALAIGSDRELAWLPRVDATTTATDVLALGTRKHDVLQLRRRLLGNHDATVAGTDFRSDERAWEPPAAPPEGSLERVLICGLNDGVVSTVAALRRRRPEVAVRLVVRSQEDAETLRSAFRWHADAVGQCEATSPYQLLPVAPGDTASWALHGDPEAWLSLVVGDWGDDEEIARLRGWNPSAWILTWNAAETPDGATVLCWAKLNSMDHDSNHPRAGDESLGSFRLIAQVQDDDVASALMRTIHHDRDLDQPLDVAEAGRPVAIASPRHTIIAGSRARHSLLAQAVNSRMVAQALLQLFGPGGPNLGLRRLDRDCPEGELLLDGLYASTSEIALDVVLGPAAGGWDIFRSVPRNSWKSYMTADREMWLVTMDHE